MNIECEHGVKIINGLSIYILCSLINSPCSFQRYCFTAKDVINTEGAKTCVGRAKKELNIAEESKMDLNDTVQDEAEVKQKEETKKEFGTVSLISKSGIFYDYNGQSRFLTGKFNVKIGDRVDILGE